MGTGKKEKSYLEMRSLKEAEERVRVRAAELCC